MRVTHGSLFNGIGGFQLAAEWIGWDNVMSCEIDDFCNKVTKFYWPKCIQYGDIKTTDFTIWRGKIDILSGGFPCQPYSHAGKRLGKEDERHLWPEMLRAIRQIQPKFVVGENVRGIINWNGGLVFEEVQTDLEASGYEVQTFILPACAVNAPHRRDRVWFIAHSTSIGTQGFRDEYGFTKKTASKRKTEQIISPRINAHTNSERQTNEFKYNTIGGNSERVYNEESTSNTSCKRQSGSWGTEGQINSEENENWKKHRVVDDGKWPTVSPFCSGNDGLSHELDGITFSKWASESIKGAGNAIVPQIAYEIFKSLNL